MAKAKRQRLRKGGDRVRVDPRIPPTLEQMRHADYSSAGMAYKRTPVIDTMLARGQLNDDHHRRLSYYRDQASLAERSLTKSCLDQRTGGGSGDGHISAAVTSAILTTARIERDMGQLADIARAVAVDDKSLSQWCIDKHGGRERYDGKGKFISIVPLCEKKVMGIALLELRYAAGTIVA